MRLHSHREVFPFVRRAPGGKAVLKDMHLGIIDPQNLFAETEETENEAPIPEEEKEKDTLASSQNSLVLAREDLPCMEVPRRIGKRNGS